MPSNLRVQVVRLADGVGLPLPAYMSEHAAGADVCAAVSEDVILLPGGRALIPTGFVLAIPPGYEVQVRPRSGLALRSGVTILNAPGTIDADYRGPVAVILVNFGNEPFVVRRGDRIAQMILVRVARADFAEVENVDDTDRGPGGFGSTGTAMGEKQR